MVTFCVIRLAESRLNLCEADHFQARDVNRSATLET